MNYYFWSISGQLAFTISQYYPYYAFQPLIVVYTVIIFTSLKYFAHFVVNKNIFQHAESKLLRSVRILGSRSENGKQRYPSTLKTISPPLYTQNNYYSYVLKEYKKKVIKYPFQ